MPQVPHIALQLRPPVKPRAGRRAASRPPADAGRRNMTHIIIRHSGELGKEGRVRGAGVRDGRRGQPGPGTFVQGS